MGSDVAVEEQFGPYLVYERLGVGGMATVHRALERAGVEGFERVVALKRLLPHLAEDASFIKAFVREAKLASLLTHVNIVQIYELGRVGTEYFISMEYIDGRDIRRILRHARKVTGPPPIHVTVGLLLQLCEALDYAHNKSDDDGSPLGLVHRDVSPSNLLVTSSGHLKVIDFGIAKAQSSQLRTQTGRVKGKLAYMAPEAVSGSRELDARSDVWAVGVILHELLTARPLFASKNEYQTLLKVQRGDIMPPSTFNQACPPELDAIVFKALARDPDDRFSGASELRDELLQVRRAYQLHTGVRDVAQWLDWAFALEVPAGFSGNTLEPSQVSPAARAVRRTRDDDDAVEMVWGTGDGDVEASGPVVLDDVPDVSEKHVAARVETDVSDDDISDDIPTPQPSHGSRKSQPPRGSDPRLPPRPDPAIARGTDPPRRPQRSTAPGIAVRSDRSSAQRLDAPSMGDRLAAQRARDSEPPPNQPYSRLPSADNVRTDPDGLPMIGRDQVGQVATPTSAPELSVEGLFVGDLDDASTLVPDGGERPDGPEDTLLEMAAQREPAVRFSTSKRMRAVNAEGGLASLRPPPRTKPGVQPAARPKQPPSIAPASQKPVIGASMVERNKPARRGWLLVLGLVLIAGGAAAVAMYAMTGNDSPTKHVEPPPAPSHDPGTVKFVTEPADSEVQVEGQSHTGSPWSLELPPGPHQIEIHHSGYKAWLTSIELSPKETQTFRVVLEPLGKGSTQTDATLSLTTTPPDLEVVLDGQPLAQHTPIKIPIKVGTHVVVVRKGTVELWRQTIIADASSVYELNPILTDDKPHDHHPGAIVPPSAKTTKRPPPEPQKVDKPEPDKVEPAPPAPEVKPELPPAPLPVPPPVAPPPPTPAPLPAPPPPQLPSHTAPVTVAPNAVTKLSGSLPNISKFTKAELPSVAAAKLCIDVGGAVTSVDFVTKLEKHAATDLGDALRTWRYTPYREKGIAFSACFVVTLRMK